MCGRSSAQLARVGAGWWGFHGARGCRRRQTPSTATRPIRPRHPPTVSDNRSPRRSHHPVLLQLGKESESWPPVTPPEKHRESRLPLPNPCTVCTNRDARKRCSPQGSQRALHTARAHTYSHARSLTHTHPGAHTPSLTEADEDPRTKGGVETGFHGTPDVQHLRGQSWVPEAPPPRPPHLSPAWCSTSQDELLPVRSERAPSGGQGHQENRAPWNRGPRAGGLRVLFCVVSTCLRKKNTRDCDCL